jgi:predicted DNA-binding transcriptional regulator YafY
MNRDQRLYELVQRLRDGRLHTAHGLATALGVSTRTIWRDMAVLAATGLPVEGERGLGYILRAPLMLPPMVLSQEELDALLAALEAAAAAPGPEARAARSLLYKITTLLPQAGPPQPPPAD